MKLLYNGVIFLTVFFIQTILQAQPIVVALQGEFAPGTNSTFSGFDSHQFFVGKQGEFAFGANLSGGPLGDRGYWAGEAGNLQLVAHHLQGTPDDTGSVFILAFTNQSLTFDPDSKVGLLAVRKDTAANDSAAAIWTGEINNLQLVAKKYDAAPGISSTFFSINKHVTNGNEVAFYAFVDDAPAGVTSEDDEGLWSGPPGGLGLVVRENEQMQGQPFGAGFAITSNTEFIIDNNGLVSFNASSKPGNPPAFGIYRGNTASGLLLVADDSLFGAMNNLTVNNLGKLGFVALSNTIAKEIRVETDTTIRRVMGLGDFATDENGLIDPDSLVFTDLFGYVLTDSGYVTLMAETSDGKTGIWQENKIGLIRLVREGDPAPGTDQGHTFTNIRAMVANNYGQVAFQSQTTLPPASYYGYWGINDGLIFPIIIPFDEVEVMPGDIRTVRDAWGNRINPNVKNVHGTGADGYPTYLNDNGDLLFEVLFTDLTTALVWINFNSLVSVDENPSYLNSFKLYQNYPNPFNPVTKIRFQIQRTSYVSLKIFNLLGQHIETLLDEKLASNQYEIKWNPGNLASGVYFYRLEGKRVDGRQDMIFSETKKLILLK